MKSLYFLLLSLLLLMSQSKNLFCQPDDSCVPSCGTDLYTHLHQIDQHPDFPNWQELKSEYSYVECPSPVFSVSCDGQRSSRFEVVWELNDDCSYFIINPELKFLDESYNILDSPDADEYGVIHPISSGAYEVTAEYTHPKDPPPSGQMYREVMIATIYTSLISGGPSIGSIIKVRIYRPPVLMIHGLWSGAAAFETMENTLIGSQYKQYMMKRMDYSNTNASSFATNEGQVPVEVTALINQCIDQDHAVGKVDLTVHSMGGILSRLYLQNNYRNDVRRLITCNTPHAGSQMANFLLDPTLSIPSTICSALGFAGMPCDEGAVEDLQVGSTEIDLLNMGIHPADVEVHALTTVETIDTVAVVIFPNATISAASLLASLASQCGNQFIDQIFNLDDHDLVVAGQSQAGGLSGDPTSAFEDQQHMGSVANAEVINEVRLLFNEGENSSRFVTSGYQPPTLSYNSNLPCVFFHDPGKPNVQTRNVASVQITSPLDNTAIQSGVPLTVEVLGQEVDSMLIAFAYRLDSFVVYPISGVQATIQLQIPETTDLGEKGLVLFGFSNGELVTNSGIKLGVETTEDLVSIEIIPQKIFLQPGQSTSILVEGTYNDGVKRSLTQLNTLAYSFTSGSASSSGPGLITLNGNLNDALTISWNGISSNEVDIIDVAPSTILPVTWVKVDGRFDAVRNASLLTWHVADEHHVDHYLIERAFHDNAWESVGMIPVNQNGSAAGKYQFSDPVSTDKLIRYRIVNVDLDGSKSNSPIITIKTKSTLQESGWVAYPNPSNDGWWINNNAKNASQTQYILQRTDGSIIRKGTNTNDQELDKFWINADDIAPGIYFLKIIANGNEKTLYLALSK